VFRCVGKNFLKFPFLFVHDKNYRHREFVQTLGYCGVSISTRATSVKKPPKRWKRFRISDLDLDFLPIAGSRIQGSKKGTGSRIRNTASNKLVANIVNIGTRYRVACVSRYQHHRAIWIKLTVSSRVSDPHWFNADPDTDPDPAFCLIADPDSGSGSRIRILDPDPGFDDLKLKKIYSWKFNFYFLDQKFQFTYP